MNDSGAGPKKEVLIGEDVVPAVKDAKLLVAYANETGLALTDDVTRTIVDTERLVAVGSMSVDQEVAFWKAYQTIARVIAPANVASLRAVQEGDSGSRGLFRGWTNRSLARKTVQYYMLLALFVLAVLLVFQTYQLFGSTIVSEIRGLNKDLAELIIKRDSLPRDADQRTSVEAELETIRLRKTASYGLLGWWNECLPSWLAPITKVANDQDDDEAAQRLATFQRAQMVIDVLQRYILPLLYGLLGSCVYALRTLATQIRGRTYTEAANIDFNLRMCIGALSGLIVGWFVAPEPGGGALATLSPSALAFLAGYSIDLLFSALDRILAAFSSGGESTRAEEPKVQGARVANAGNAQ